ncbi:uncharacterized protein FFC1_15916 [Fusarium fujikuroi]|nr:uncharacterized protein FPRN_15186 [Fusarium proliferatum]SCO26251.1 uncharacterized protein FFC1_15916 [Fusarium fujikuroi]
MANHSREFEDFDNFYVYISESLREMELLSNC